MADFDWPADLVPFAQTFFLQPHVVRSVSPFTRQQKVYGLSAPLWMCRMSFRGGYNGRRGAEAYGPRLDAFLAKLKGGENRVAIHDFRRPEMRGRAWSHSASNALATSGATSLVITGISPHGETALAGDYVGGDGRPHIILDDARADDSGEAMVTFEPPLSADIVAGGAVFGNPTGWFRLTSDDAGANGVEVGQAAMFDLEFIEDI